MNEMEVPHGKWWHGVCVWNRWTLHVACLASLWAMASAETATPPTSPCQQYVRGLASTVWGFIVTLISLTVDGWGTHKNRGEGIFMKMVVVLFLGATLNPLLSVHEKTRDFLASIKLSKRLKDVPSAKPYIKILTGCYVYVNLPVDSSEKFKNGRPYFSNKLRLDDFSDALRIGSPVGAENFLRLQLHAKEMLIRANVLPPVEQLKILQGQSGFAIAATVVQAIGYMYGVIVRLVQGRHVTPIEAIAFVLNLVVLMKGMWHFYSSTCHRPLILFLDGEELDRFASEFEKPFPIHITRVEDDTWKFIMNGTIVILFGGMLMFFIIKSVKSLPFIVAIPIIIVEGSVIVSSVHVVLKYVTKSRLNPIPNFLIVMLVLTINVVGYIFALVVTMKYWNSAGFNIQSSNYLSHLLPYIG